MNTNDIVIRLERNEDIHTTESLIRDSFWNVYRPGCSEHYLMHNLRLSDKFIPELNFVMYKDGTMIGQNVFYPAVIDCDDGTKLPVMTMGPICIANEYKRQGYGKYLLDYTLEKAREYGCNAVLFEGNIRFYSNCGFSFASEFGIRYHGLPEGMNSLFFLCRELIEGCLDGITGEYASPYDSMADETEAEEYDKQFPKKEKLKLPGQLVK